MISEAAMTGKPIYVAQMKPNKNNNRFRKFFELFKSLNIIKDLEDSWKNGIMINLMKLIRFQDI